MPASASSPPSWRRRRVNRLIEGTARGWREAQPCWPLLVMQRSMAANPVLLVDEIDKATASHNGDVRATLLGMLEIETARSWFDACLLVPADLSQISWVLTANTAEALPRPLLSRLRVVRVDHPGPDAFEDLLETNRKCALEHARRQALGAFPALTQPSGH